MVLEEGGGIFETKGFTQFKEKQKISGRNGIMQMRLIMQVSELYLLHITGTFVFRSGVEGNEEIRMHVQTEGGGGRRFATALRL